VRSGTACRSPKRRDSDSLRSRDAHLEITSPAGIPGRGFLLKGSRRYFGTLGELALRQSGSALYNLTIFLFVRAYWLIL
jgi:hypothetical protein